MVKYIKGKNTSVCDLDGDVNVDSDCEVDLPGVRKGTVKAKDENEDETRAVLITGSFAAYVMFNPVLCLRK